MFVCRPRNKWLDHLRNDSTGPTSGGVLSTVGMVVQRRDGPRRLRDNDDDDNDDVLCQQIKLIITGNESVPKTIINDTIKLSFLNCNQHFGSFKP